MSGKLLLLGLIVAFSICYMEWGGNNSGTVAGMEYFLFANSEDLWSALTHPLILAGIIGQLCLVYAVFFNRYKRVVSVAGVVLLGLVVLMISLAAVFSMNMKMILSVLPYIILSIIFFVRLKRRASIAKVSSK